MRLSVWRGFCLWSKPLYCCCIGSNHSHTFPLPSLCNVRGTKCFNCLRLWLVSSRGARGHSAFCGCVYRRLSVRIVRRNSSYADIEVDGRKPFVISVGRITDTYNICYYPYPMPILSYRRRPSVTSHLMIPHLRDWHRYTRCVECQSTQDGFKFAYQVATESVADASCLCILTREQRLSRSGWMEYLFVWNQCCHACSGTLRLMQ